MSAAVRAETVAAIKWLVEAESSYRDEKGISKQERVAKHCTQVRRLIQQGYDPIEALLKAHEERNK